MTDDLVSIADNMTTDDLPGNESSCYVSMREVGMACSVIDAVKLMIYCPGVPLFIPMCGLREMRIRHIKEHYTGSNMLSIAVKLRIDTTEVIRLSKIAKRITLPNELEMPNEYMRQVAELCGQDLSIRLMHEFPNKRVYVPTGGLFQLKKRYIEANFNGQNVVDLALKLQTSEYFVRKTISDLHAARTPQLSLFN